MPICGSGQRSSGHMADAPTMIYPSINREHHAPIPILMFELWNKSCPAIP